MIEEEGVFATGVSKSSFLGFPRHQSRELLQIGHSDVGDMLVWYTF